MQLVEQLGQRGRLVGQGGGGGERLAIADSGEAGGCDKREQHGQSAAA
jgi:hypothetical protein